MRQKPPGNVTKLTALVSSPRGADFGVFSIHRRLPATELLSFVQKNRDEGAKRQERTRPETLGRPKT
jgi:hypothetical protein